MVFDVLRGQSFGTGLDGDRQAADENLFDLCQRFKRIAIPQHQISLFAFGKTTDFCVQPEQALRR
jgi:hypothetical protein